MKIKTMLIYLLFNLSLSTNTFASLNNSIIENTKIIKEKANQGNIDAQFNLGAMYLKGLGVKQNYNEAVKYLKLAADQGNVDAHLTWALCTLTVLV